MGRFDVTRRPAPVQIGQAQTRALTQVLGTGSQQVADGAGDYGQREPRFAPVPIRIRIDKSGGPNTQAALAGTIPLGQTQRKAGYPPIEGYQPQTEAEQIAEIEREQAGNG